MSITGRPQFALAAAAVAAACALGGCGSQKTTSGGKTDVYIANAQDGQIASCRTRMGGAAITESDQNAQALQSEGLPRSMAPLMRQLLMQSHCFAVLERGPAFAVLENEMRIREQQGGTTRSMQLAGLTPADYVIRGEIVFVEQTAGGKGAIGALFNNVLGGVGLERKQREALVVISAVDVRTSEIVAASFGRGSQESSGLSSVILGGGIVGLQGAWLDSPQAKPVAAALVDAWNQLLPRLVAAREVGSPPPGSDRKAGMGEGPPPTKAQPSPLPLTVPASQAASAASSPAIAPPPAATEPAAPPAAPASAPATVPEPAVPTAPAEPASAPVAVARRDAAPDARLR